MKNDCIKCDGKSSSRHFFKKLKLIIPLNQQSEFSHRLVLLFNQVEDYQTYWNQSFNHFLLLHIKLFHKTKKGLELVSLPHFIHHVWKEIFHTLYFINLLNTSLPYYLYFLRHLGIMFIVTVCVPVSEGKNFQVYLGFLIKLFSYITKNVRTKM